MLRLPMLLVLRVLVAVMLVGQMPPDDAAADGAQDHVMPGIMPGNPADDGAFEATLGLCLAGGEAREGGDDGQTGGDAAHG